MEAAAAPMAKADLEDQWNDIDDEIIDEDHTRRELHQNSVRKPTTTLECGDKHQHQQNLEQEQIQ